MDENRDSFMHKTSSTPKMQLSRTRQTYAREKLSPYTFVRHLLSEKNFTVLDKQSDFNSSQALHYERFFSGYACHDCLITAFFGSTVINRSGLS
jgi:hypothetical protein